MKKFPTRHMTGDHVEYLGSNRELDFYLYRYGNFVSPTIQYGPEESEYASRGLLKDEFDKLLKDEMRKFPHWDDTKEAERLAKLFIVMKTLPCAIMNTIKTYST